MKWEKKGKIFPLEQHEHFFKYASLPVPILLNETTLRVFFSNRNEIGQSTLYYIDCLPENPKIIQFVSKEEVLNLGAMGTFDDSGIMPSWIVNYNNKYYLYYIGWNPQVNVSYRLSIGLAVSEDCVTFNKISDGPICDRSYNEPYFNTAPCVLFMNGHWKMWYVSCTKWEMVNGHPEPFYHIKYAESTDGIHWEKQKLICIDYDEFTHGLGKPCVYLESGIYKMIYSYRNSENYRNDKDMSYRLGYAESIDGINWTRKDKRVGIHRSNDGWDSEMVEYSSTYVFKGKRYLLYNGNGFGKSGFGYAVLKDD